MTNNKVSVSFPVVSFRKIAMPTEDTFGRMYVSVLKVSSIPKEFREWRGINPRDPKTNSGVSKKIAKTLEEKPDAFLYRNRGMTVIAESLSFDNQTNLLTVDFSIKDQHGLLDGGHTYEVISEFLEEMDDLARSECVAMVRLEILEGVNPDDISMIVESRNTSTQVKDQSIEELRGTFESIKKVLSGENYKDRIAYKEHELDEQGSSKDIDIKDVLSYLVCFDSEHFTDKKHPIIAYSGKAAVLNHFTGGNNTQEEKNKQVKRMEKYVQLLPDILKLHDVITGDLPEAYNSGIDGEGGGKFGRLTGVTAIAGKKRMQNDKLDFSGEESEYRIPSAFVYPILGAFRSIIRVENNKASWLVDPFEYYNKLRLDLAATIGLQAKTFGNPTKMGKDLQTWQACYSVVQIQALKDGLI